MKNEKTSARVAKIAARVLAAKWISCVIGERGGSDTISDADVRAVFASALTQTADKPKRGKWTARKVAMRKKT